MTTESRMWKPADRLDITPGTRIMVASTGYRGTAETYVTPDGKVRISPVGWVRLDNLKVWKL